MHRTNKSRASQQSRSALPAVPTRFLTPRDSFPEYKGVTVGNSGAIWIWAGGLTISRSQTSFQNSISTLYSYQSVQPAPGPLCACCTHGLVLRFIVCAQRVQRCSEQTTLKKKKLLNELKKIRVNFSTKCNYIFPPKSNLFEMSCCNLVV